MHQPLSFTIAAALLALGTAAVAQDKAAQGAANDEALKQFCALNQTSSVCEAGQAGKQARDGLDLAAEIVKGEQWKGAPETRGDHMSCLSAWAAVRDAVAGGDARWPKSVTVKAATAQVQRWEKLAAIKYKGLEDRLPGDRAKADAAARADIGSARIADLAQWAGFCKRAPTG